MSSTLSPLASHILENRGFKSIGEALLSCAIYSTPVLFSQKELLVVNNRIHDTVIQFSRVNRLRQQVFYFRNEWDYKDHHWNRIVRLIGLYPGAAGEVYKYQASNTLLSRLISSKAPARVISALLEVAPHLVSVDFWGITALHTACRENMSLDVIEALLSVPSGVVAAGMQDSSGMTPLHNVIDKSYTIHPYTLYVVNALLAANPAAAKMKTNTGWTPFALASIRPTSPEVKQALEAAMNA